MVGDRAGDGSGCRAYTRTVRSLPTHNPEVTVSKRTADIVIRVLTGLTILGLVLAAVLYDPLSGD